MWRGFSIAVCAAWFLAGCQYQPDSPLTAAVRQGDLPQVKRLLIAGAEADAPGGSGLTPLVWAARGGQVAVLRTLLMHGADPDRRAGRNGWTPLMHAIHKGQEQAAMVLVDNGAAVDATSGNGTTALIMAAGYGYAGIVGGLLKRGANPYAASSDGQNALTAAVGGVPDIDRFTVARCQTDTVQALLAKAPDLQLGKDLPGRAARLAARIGNCADVLRSVQTRASRAP